MNDKVVNNQKKRENKQISKKANKKGKEPPLNPILFEIVKDEEPINIEDAFRE